MLAECDKETIVKLLKDPCNGASFPQKLLHLYQTIAPAELGLTWRKLWPSSENIFICSSSYPPNQQLQLLHQ